MIPIHDDAPTRQPPVFTVVFIAACVLVFLWQIGGDPVHQQNIIYALGVIPSVLLGNAYLDPQLVWVPAFATVFTSMFLHGGWMHLVGNMLFLWVFGNNVEEATGHVRFIVFYLLCGVAAVFAQTLPNPDSTIPMVGASGAISGVLGAYLLLLPAARVLVVIPMGFYFPTVRLPAALVLGLWFVLQLVNSLLADPGQGGVAFGAHIGGFIAGMALIPLFKKRGVRLSNPITALGR
jgi:membrane associated rhomboid family serine protease